MPHTQHQAHILKGVSATPGRCLGQAYILDHGEMLLQARHVPRAAAQAEFEKFEQACTLLTKDLEKLQHYSIVAGSDDISDIVATQQAILMDPDLHAQVNELINRQGFSADYAVHNAFRNYLQLLERSSNQLILERVTDVRDVRDRLIRKIQQHEHEAELPNGAVIIADDLSPTELIQLSRRQILGVALNLGGKTSHTTIIANALGIPCIIGLKSATQFIKNGDEILLDADAAQLIINPNASERETFEWYISSLKLKDAERREILDRPSKTTCGQPFALSANIELTEELPKLRLYKSAGIGLVRTESLMMDDQNEVATVRQIAFYEACLKACEPYPVTIRLFDIGGDKLNEGTKESNPYLGWRGVRVLLDKSHLLRSQLRSILEISGLYPGRVRLMIPMVSRVEEIREVKAVLKTIQQELHENNIAYDASLRLGIMVEVPSVVFQADHFAKEVDFFSIGTNDLIQYILAVDRGNTLISDLYSHFHPSVWAAIAQVMRAASRVGIPVSVCGEAASDPIAAACFIGLGVNELSMVPSAIPEVKKFLTEHSLHDLAMMAERLIQCTTIKEAEATVSGWIERKFSQA